MGNGVVCAEFDRKDIAANKLVVTTLESKFRVYDMQTQHPVEGYAYLEEKAHKATVWLARHLPQNRDLWMTTGGNGGMNIYKYGASFLAPHGATHTPAFRIALARGSFNPNFSSSFAVAIAGIATP